MPGGKWIAMKTMKLSKNSKVGVAVAGVYFLVALAAFVGHIYSTRTNPADSGESALLFYLLSLPWMKLIPAPWMYSQFWPWLAYPVAWLCITLNIFLVFRIISLACSMAHWARGKAIGALRNP
jgi:hypothetical protein